MHTIHKWVIIIIKKHYTKKLIKYYEKVIDVKKYLKMNLPFFFNSTIGTYLINGKRVNKYDIVVTLVNYHWTP